MDNQIVRWMSYPWFLSGVRVSVVIVAGLLIHFFIRRGTVFLERSVERFSQDKEHQKRVETFIRVIRSFLAVGNLFLVLALSLSVLGIPVAPLLTAAGIGGVAIGFASQSLVKDYFSGAVFLLEGQLRVGDWVEVNSVSGVIEEITLRYIKVRDLDGKIIFVPNGSISNLANRSLGKCWASFEITVEAGVTSFQINEAFQRALGQVPILNRGVIKIGQDRLAFRIQVEVFSGAVNEKKSELMEKIAAHLHDAPIKGIIEIV